MAERNPHHYQENHKIPDFRPYTKEVQAFTDEILPRESKDGVPTSLEIPVDTDSVRQVQQKLENGPLAALILDPEDTFDSFSEGTESTHVTLIATSWNWEKDIIPDADPSKPPKYADAPGWKREIGIRMGYASEGHNAVQIVYMSANSRKEDKAPKLRGVITKRRSEEVYQTKKVDATEEQAQFFMDIAKELYTRHREGPKDEHIIWEG